MRDQIKISLLDRIKSDIFMLYAAIFTVAFLAPNTYYVYYSFCVFASPWRELASAGVSCIVAASILIYTLRKNFRVAKYYSIFEVSISAYYYINTIGWNWGLIPALGFTLILPVSIYYYSKEIGANAVKIDSELLQRIGVRLTEDNIKLMNENSELNKNNKLLIDRDLFVREKALESIKDMHDLKGMVEELEKERDHYKGLYEINKETYVQLSGRGNRLVPTENIRAGLSEEQLQEEKLIEQQLPKVEHIKIVATIDNEKFIEELKLQEQQAKPEGKEKEVKKS